jgi:hypothetical protein
MTARALLNAPNNGRLVMCYIDLLASSLELDAEYLPRINEAVKRYGPYFSVSYYDPETDTVVDSLEGSQYMLRIDAKDQPYSITLQ